VEDPVKDTTVLETDFLTGIRTIFHPDIHHGTGNIIETVQDAEPIVEANKAAASNFDERSRFKGDGFHRVASIPLVIYHQLVKDGVTQDQAAFRKWLNDRDNMAFRTRPGRI
jgi:hypothetical protein